MVDAPPAPAEMVTLGRIVGLFGVRGELKVESHTDPADGLLEYPEWTLELPGGAVRKQVMKGRPHGRLLVVHLEGLADCDAARTLIGADVKIARSELPKPASGEYYRIDLIGLNVVNEQGEELGRVSHFVETHPEAPAAMVVRGAAEHWLPADPRVIRRVDLAAGEIRVDWIKDDED